MYKLKAFFKLLRLNNLIFIVLTQFLFQYALIPHVIEFGYHANSPENWAIDSFHFFLIVMASVFIAAGGYIINDYFDVNIDLINKPQNTYIETVFSRRTAIKLHFALTTIGLFFSGYVAYYSNFWWLLLGNFIAAITLIIYSVSLKRKTLIGNFAIGFLIVYTIAIIMLMQIHKGLNFETELPKFLRISGAYIFFSFITTLAREAIKDLEDMEGDRKDGCTTLPIAYGVPVAKMYSMLLLVVTLVLLLGICVYILSYQLYLPFIYAIAFLIAPCIYLLQMFYKAKNKADYNKASRCLKIIMLMGILSMLFFIKIN